MFFMTVGLQHIFISRNKAVNQRLVCVAQSKHSQFEHATYYNSELGIVY